MIVENGETVTVVRGKGKDRNGDPLPGEPDEIDYPGCASWPSDGNATAGNEQTYQRDTVIAGVTVLFPPGADVRATDQFRRRGVLYDMNGEPQAWEGGSLSGDSVGVLAFGVRNEG